MNFQYAGFENLVFEFEQAARGQTDFLVAQVTAQTQANMVADQLRIEQTAERQVSNQQMQLLNQMNYRDKMNQQLLQRGRGAT